MGASSSSSSSSSSSLITEINVTPLVDVVLVLLVIMMVTATTLATKTIPVELPKAKSGTNADNADRPLVVSVDEKGALFLDQDQTAVDESTIRDRARRLGPKGSAVLAADGRARHESVVHALEILRSEHVVKIAIVVRSSSSSGDGR